MRKLLNSPIFVVGLVVVGMILLFQFGPLSAGPEDPVAEGEGIAWQASLPVEAQGPVLVYFTADWCGPCRTMKANVWPSRRVVEAAGAYTPVMIDIDADPRTAGMFNIDFIPQIVAVEVSAGGVRELGRTGGLLSVSDATAFLQQHAK